MLQQELLFFWGEAEGSLRVIGFRKLPREEGWEEINFHFLLFVKL